MLVISTHQCSFLRKCRSLRTWQNASVLASEVLLSGARLPHEPTASHFQLRKEERARLKSTTLSTEEGRHNAAPLHRRREAIRKGEVEREKQKERIRLREEKREQGSNPRVPLLFPSLSHIHYQRSGQPRISAALAADSRILNAELTAREGSHSHPQEMTVSVMI